MFGHLEKKETVQLPFITRTTPHRLPPERRNNKEFILYSPAVIILYALRTFRQVRGHMGAIKGQALRAHEQVGDQQLMRRVRVLHD